MMRVVLLSVVVLLIGCGNDQSNRDPLQLSGEFKNEFNTNGGIYPNGYSCIDTGSSTVAEMTNQGSWPTLTFSFNNSVGLNKERLTSSASKEQRCKEVIAYVLSDPKIDFNFHSPSEKDQSMAESGAKISLKPQWVTLKYQDGTMNEHSININLRCESEFQSSCLGSECEDYLVHVPSEVCTFRESGTLFEFSNHKEGVIDLSGEIDFLNPTKPVFKITSLSVVVEN